jgi:hypothetical protein
MQRKSSDADTYDDMTQTQRTCKGLCVTLLRAMGDQGRHLEMVAGILRDQGKEAGLEASLRLTGNLRQELTPRDRGLGSLSLLPAPQEGAPRFLITFILMWETKKP